MRRFTSQGGVRRLGKKLIPLAMAGVFAVGIVFGGAITAQADGTSNKTGALAFWNTQEDGEGTSYSQGADLSGIKENTDLYGQWAIADAGAGTVDSDKLVKTEDDGTVTLQESAVTPPDGSDETMLGWMTSSDMLSNLTATNGTAPEGEKLIAMKNVNLNGNVTKLDNVTGNGTAGTYEAVYGHDIDAKLESLANTVSSGTSEGASHYAVIFLHYVNREATYDYYSDVSLGNLSSTGSSANASEINNVLRAIIQKGYKIYSCENGGSTDILLTILFN